MIVSHKPTGMPIKTYVIKEKGDLVNFINNCLNPKVKWLDVGYELDSLLKSMYDSDETYTLKKWYHSYSSLLKPYANQRSLNYWLIRGYSEADATENVRHVQSKSGLKFSENIKNDPSKYTAINPTQIGYWMKHGHNEEDAKLKVKERQITFSLETCISKWGASEGYKKFRERQDKWQSAINSSLGITWEHADKNCRGLSQFDSIVDLAKDYVAFSFLSDDVKKCYHTIINNNMCDSDDILSHIKKCSYEEMLLWANLKPVQSLLCMSRYVIIEHWLKLSPNHFAKGTWGRLYYYGDNYFQSTGEFAIGAYLLERGIEFVMHKRYPVGERLMYDFYLPSFDVYIEYCGMDPKKYAKKEGYLSKQNLNIIWDRSVDNILEKLDSLLVN